MSISAETLTPVVELVEQILDKVSPDDTRDFEYVLLILNKKDGDCDYVSSIHPKDALFFIANWLRGMMEADIIEKNDGPAGHA